MPTLYKFLRDVQVATVADMTFLLLQFYDVRALTASKGPDYLIPETNNSNTDVYPLL
jgi:hypothetical protein